MDDLIGKFAYKKRGFYSELIGKIEKNDKGISKYKLVTKMGTTIGFNKKEEIVLIDIDE